MVRDLSNGLLTLRELLPRMVTSKENIFRRKGLLPFFRAGAWRRDFRRIRPRGFLALYSIIRTGPQGGLCDPNCAFRPGADVEFLPSFLASPIDLAGHSMLNQRAAASAVSSGRVLNAIADLGAAL